MKQHRLTSERTTTPADNKPNALDITAIRERLSARLLAASSDAGAERMSIKGWVQPLLLRAKEVSSHFPFARELNRNRKGG